MTRNGCVRAHAGADCLSGSPGSTYTHSASKPCSRWPSDCPPYRGLFPISSRASAGGSERKQRSVPSSPSRKCTPPLASIGDRRLIRRSHSRPEAALAANVRGPLCGRKAELPSTSPMRRLARKNSSAERPPGQIFAVLSSRPSADLPLPSGMHNWFAGHRTGQQPGNSLQCHLAARPGSPAYTSAVTGQPT